MADLSAADVQYGNNQPTVKLTPLEGQQVQAAQPADTLPFTGMDVTGILALGLLLLVAGISLRSRLAKL